MPISSTNRKAGPFHGDGIVDTLPFEFKVFNDTELLVIKADALGAESTLVLTTDYTVTLNSDQEVDPGGEVVLVAPLPLLESVVVTSDLPELQPIDITNQGGFYPAVMNQALDRLTILTQQLRVDVGRSAKLPITRTEDADALLADVVLLADNIASVLTVGGSIGSVNAVAAVAADVAAVAAALDDIAAALADLPSLAAKVSKAGDTMTGHLVAIAGATGSQVPRRSEVVGSTGDETIAGIKTFSSAPVVPASATGSHAVRADETVRNVGGAARFPTWTTAGRPATPADGDTGKNTDLDCNETWSAAYSAWIQEGLQSGAEAALAGTAFDFTGIPAWAAQATLEFYGLSTNGTSEPLFQLITSAAVTSGYAAASTGTSGTASSSRSSSAGVQLTSTAAANVLHGKLELKRSKASAFRWWISGEVQVVGQVGTMTLSGFIDLGADVLTGVRATTTGGANTFDAGTGVLSWRA
ncbi:MAG TPA: hypothetical protein DCY64_22540 [Hydrogenophaga sp.]|uniref:hypothetical protein n=1 Tax=Hydrogenophaga sp. TaxID=1904254 RepID=UPI0008C9182D|nr:hypothetical protein [Hydrogenophaga sp.]OGA78764.1 MAG: hypothetical protein A2X73_07380 [Burkholderiales bacterium GWE1_65_30]OGA89335.1 MAG: hypothetical protein A2X72_16540 [Burkholderiales bacterium GWF1_66_17]HAX23051.1 hypothetical protein [Hydrogenophaga sp.]HBU17085.1 hypothetical protein [Hydrogenophaga sp.]